MIPKNLNSLLDTELARQVNIFCHADEFKKRLLYTLLPAGKYIRSHLVFNLASDFDIKDTNQLLLLCSAIEAHHTYTLIHDDLPCMDNDIYRRGRLAHHHQFSEWEAVLSGDALLNLSYQILAQIDHPNTIKLIRLLGWAAGAKGLIYGQYLDLYEEKNNNSTSFERVNLLKTARLFQVSCLGSYYLSTDKPQFKQVKQMLRMGQQIGLLFQLIDDLDDYLEGKEELSYFSNSPQKTKELLMESHQSFINLLNQNKLNSTLKFFNSSFFRIENIKEKLSSIR